MPELANKTKKNTKHFVHVKIILIVNIHNHKSVDSFKRPSWYQLNLRNMHILFMQHSCALAEHCGFSFESGVFRLANL